MRRNLLPMLLLWAAASLAVSAMTDAEMRRRIAGSARVFDNPDVATAELRYVLRCCEYDTNRFLSAMQAVAVEKPKLSDYICQELGKYGNATCLPFLYQNLTNSAARSYAASSMLKIGLFGHECGSENVMKTHLNLCLQTWNADASHTQSLVELAWLRRPRLCVSFGLRTNVYGRAPLGRPNGRSTAVRDLGSRSIRSRLPLTIRAQSCIICGRTVMRRPSGTGCSSSITRTGI